jgi:tRNA/rRNA methyltransferase
MADEQQHAPGVPDAGALAQIRIVLVRPRGAANIGAAARAMKNMGLRDLTLVAPAVRRTTGARVMAVHARDVLSRARTVARIGEAVADCQLVVGTTCRGGPYRAAAEDLCVAAPRVLEAARAGPVALLFGPEDHGLTNDDLQHCQRLISIDTDDDYPSLNLAQAVLLCCFELRRAAGVARPDAHQQPAAPAAAVEQMLVRLQEALLKIGFLLPDNPAHIMLALRQLFGRTMLDEREVRIFLGLARQIEWYARTHRPPVADERGEAARG